MWRLILIGALISLINAQSIKDSVVCQHFCDCDKGPANWPDVDCSNHNKNILAAFTDPKNFNAGDGGKNFSMKSIILQNIPIMELNITFASINVTHLDLSNTRLTDILDGAFRNLQDMETLDLSHNQLEMIAPHAFQGNRMDGSNYPLKSLKTLRLDYNNIHSLNNDLFQYVDRRLENLYLSNNPFKIIDTPTLQALSSLSYLKILDLSYTGIKSLPENYLHTPLYLNILYLSGNNITDIRTLGLEQSHALSEIYLDYNPFVNITEKTGFPKVDTLKKVHLSHLPELKEIGAHSLCDLNNLEELYITDNIELSKIHADALTHLDVEIPVVQPIKKLYIQNNQLAYLDLPIKWDLITDMDIRDNPWACECENQWIVDTLMVTYLKIHEYEAKQLQCSTPIEMDGRYMFDLYESKTTLRCLDAYENRPERDGTILVCVLLGVLLGCVLVLSLMYFYQRKWFGVFDHSPAAFSRQFYGRTRSTDEDDLNF